MERKLELKDIAGNIPHNLYIVTDRTDGSHLVYCARKEKLYIVGFEGGINIEFCKAVMRPLSDMFETITHEGKEIIPIIECVKMAFPLEKGNWEVHKGTCTVLNNVSGKYLQYDNETFDFRHRNGAFDFRHRNGAKITARNTHLLYDYLNELKIDYRGLIESGLAIDANTLEINPYK